MFLNHRPQLYFSGAIYNQADATIQIRGDLIMKNNHAEVKMEFITEGLPLQVQIRYAFRFDWWNIPFLK